MRPGARPSGRFNGDEPEAPGNSSALDDADAEAA
jgi:hypothetical protein